MSTSTKTARPKIKHKSIISQKQTTSCVLSDFSDSSETCNCIKDLSIVIDDRESTSSQQPSSLELHYPVFTIAVGIFDILMLFVIYIVQEGTTITSDTWIVMGSKYVPCMKPLYSTSEQEMYNTQLKSQCRPFLFPYQFFRFVTPIFLHGDGTHLLSNLIYQALVGTLLEGKYSMKKLGICYILFGSSGNIMSALCNPRSISVGASGAVYGLLLFCIIDNTLRIFPTNNIQEKSNRFFITFLSIPYFIWSICFDVDGSGRTDHAAHIGGAVMGILIAVYLCDMPECLTISSTTAYSRECAIGPTHWCKSFENAEDCGAIRHCTDTVWVNDNKYASIESSTTCKWCQKILENTYNGIQNLVNDENVIVTKLAEGCKLLSSNDFSSKCTNIINTYGTSVTSLMKNKRYATICRLMSICSSEPTIENPPVIVGQKRCTWGPSYWCSSLSNSRECAATVHCSNKVWSQQAIEKKKNDNICQYCEFVIGKLRSFINDNTTEINVEKWLSGACSMLQTKDAVDKCVQTMSKYADEILVLIKNKIDAGIICHLGEMCNEATIVVRVTPDENQLKEVAGGQVENQLKDVAGGQVEKQLKEAVVSDEKSRMLCNIIVRATYDLHTNQQKTQHEIHTFLKDDCQKLSSSELIQKCEDLVDQRGDGIYKDVLNKKELSKICDHSSDSGVAQSISQTPCDICTFVLATVKYMLNVKHPEDKVLLYIDEHLCSNLHGEIQTNCKYMIKTNGDDLIKNIQHETKPILLCTYFQVCMDKISDGTFPVQKSEMRSFLKENICDQLGPFEESCHALMETDTNRLLKTFVNDINGDVLCQMFGICPMKMSFIDNLSIKDDTNKCKRCIDDFTRRKHIAEKLLNHSSEFLHHFCGQLPQEDECVKSVDESINKLVDFIRSLDPQGICIQLKMCDQTLLEKIQPLQISSSDNIISQEMTIYIKNEICARLGPLSKLCTQIIDSEGENLFTKISKTIDPHQVCSILNICPTTKSFENCNDKCECCVSKLEDYQIRLASFLQTMLTTARALCDRMIDADDCHQAATEFETTINKIINSFNAKQICQTLSHCSTVSTGDAINGDKCTSCKNQLNIRQNNFRAIIDETTGHFLSFCSSADCRIFVELLKQQKLLNKIDEINPLTVCQNSGFCSSLSAEQSVQFFSDLMTNTFSNFELPDDICSNFGDLKTICTHLLTSKQSARYGNIYMAFVKNNLTIIDEDLRAQNTDSCDTCKNAVQSSKDFWLNTLESIRDVFLQTCDHCPEKDQCRNFYNQRYDNLKSYLDNINPEQFCQKTHICSSIVLSNTCSRCVERFQMRKDGILQGIDRIAGHFIDLCQRHAEKQCQIYVKHVHDLLQKSIEKFNPKETCSIIGFCTKDGNDNTLDFDEYEKNLQEEIEKNICSSLGSYEPLCKNVIQGNTKEIQALKLNYDITDVLKIGEDLTENLVNNEEHVACRKCKCRCCAFRVGQRKHRLQFKGNLIFSALIRSCDHCPAKQQCRKHWHMAKARFDCHIDKINPKRVCTHLGFCNKTLIDDNTEEISNNCEKTIVSEVKEIQQIDTSNSTCILCEYVMNILSNYIHSQSTEEEIEQSLKQICNQLPSILHNQCQDYIDNYGPAIIAILLREFDVSTICHKLNLCTNQMKIDITHVIKADVKTCSICNYISTNLYLASQRKSNEKSLQHALSTVCSYLSEEENSKCQIIIQLFSSNLKQLDLNPTNSFCKQLSICQTPMIELKPAVILDTKDKIESNINEEKESSSMENLNLAPKCTLCHYIISYLDAVMKNNKSEGAFEEALKKVCTILPNKERAQCEDFIKTYGSTLAQLIADMVDPDTVCRQLGMCQDSLVHDLYEQTPYTCTICHFIVTRMKFFIGLSQKETEVFTSIKESCNLYNADHLKKQCKDFLDQYGDHLIQMVSTDTEPKVACQNIGICGETYRKTIEITIPISSSTKDDKCAAGMNYWCKSRENAKLCNAIDICEREIWSKNKDIIY
ncbi:unnamed protein product [Adineta steineri]|uniref:Uncharacterized protein n=1 Tax=Adineta steineri TaxID=433720 RepID=A0A818RKJ6_9BILA|nr:unnamed protein product [Adineta steineri]